MVYPLGDQIGFVNLEQQAGTDLDVVNAAKVSFHKHSQVFQEGERGILRFLMRENHGTPFEHNYFKFHIRAPIFVIREWMRHRIGVSYNEESGRYVEMRPTFFIPSTARSQTGKPGAYRFEEMDPATRADLQDIFRRQSKSAFAAYQELLGMGVAKEQARMVLPLNLYSEFYFTCNARSLMAFCKLRSDPTAMEEIRLYSRALETFLAAKMPETFSAFNAARNNTL